MTGEQIKDIRRKNENDEREERSNILDPHIKKFRTLEKELEEICGRETGHYYRKSYRDWGSFDTLGWTQETMSCKYCEKTIRVPFSEVDSVNSDTK